MPCVVVVRDACIMYGFHPREVCRRADVGLPYGGVCKLTSTLVGLFQSQKSAGLAWKLSALRTCKTACCCYLGAGRL